MVSPSFRDDALLTSVECCEATMLTSVGMLGICNERACSGFARSNAALWNGL